MKLRRCIIMKASRMLIATLKEAPQEAIISSHILLIRAGMIRKLVAGVYNYLPLGLRVLRKVENIIKEEMDRPQPRMDRMAYGGMAATVGRVRKDQAFDNSFKYVLVGHNTIRGAAGASILNAELINKQIL